MSTLDWNAIKIFLSVARTGGLSLAAKELSISHSTVFRRIEALEKDLGARLFDRQTGQYSLTDAGRALFERADRMADIADDVARNVIGVEKGLRGVVRITAPASFAYHFLPGYFEEIRTAFPDIDLELLTSNSVYNLSDRRADIAVRVSSSPPDHLVGRKVQDLSWAIYTAASDANIAKGFDDLSSGSVIGGAGDAISHRAFEWLDKHHKEKVGYRADDLTSMAHMAARGLGYALLPTDLAIAGLKRLFEVPQITPNRLWVLTHPDLRQVDRIKTVMGRLASALAKEPRLVQASS